MCEQKYITKIEKENKLLRDFVEGIASCTPCADMAGDMMYDTYNEAKQLLSSLEELCS
jgi:hypothetical protein